MGENTHCSEAIHSEYAASLSSGCPHGRSVWIQHGMLLSWVSYLLGLFFFSNVYAAYSLGSHTPKNVTEH